MSDEIRVPYNTHLIQPNNVLHQPDRAYTFAGLRLSTDCPLERVTSYYYPNIGDEFNRGVGNMGHMLGNVFASLLSEANKNGKVTLEEAVEWECEGIRSNTHIDIVSESDEDSLRGVYEIKTTSSKSLTPRPENIRQVQRQQFACLVNGRRDLVEGYDWYIVIIGKAGNASGWVSDRILIQPDLEYAQKDYDLTKQLVKLQSAGMIDLMDIDEVKNFCLCGRCFPEPRITELDEATSNLVDDLSVHNHNMKVSTQKVKDIKDEILGTLAPGKYQVGDTKITVTDSSVILR